MAATKPKPFTKYGIKFYPVTKDSEKIWGFRYKADWFGNTQYFSTKKSALEWAKNINN